MANEAPQLRHFWRFKAFAKGLLFLSAAKHLVFSLKYLPPPKPKPAALARSTRGSCYLYCFDDSPYQKRIFFAAADVVLVVVVDVVVVVAVARSVYF